MIADDFNNITAEWETVLQQYSFKALCKKPAATEWSLGQVYIHLISTTKYFIQQAVICAAGNEHAAEEAHAAALGMFADNMLPDKDLQGPPSNNDTPQPESKQQIQYGLQQLKIEMETAAALVANSNGTGKTKHPGLQYFNAKQWLQFAIMHMRHHLRQKNKLSNLLIPGN